MIIPIIGPNEQFKNCDLMFRLFEILFTQGKVFLLPCNLVLHFFLYDWYKIHHLLVWIAFY